MTFDFSDVADSLGAATGLRALAQPMQSQQPCTCCSHRADETPRRKVPLDYDLFRDDQRAAPPVIGAQD